MRPLLLLEINEVPWRLVDKALALRRFRHLERFFAAADTYTTLAEDEGELSPWITWPTLHRGTTDHGIRELGQDVATFRGQPIWRDFRARGLSVGVCGSLQSWPPIDPGPGGFYVPDTFAHDARCIPRHLEPLQRFNLAQVRRNGRVVDGGLRPAEIAAVAPALVRARVRLRTMLRAARQLAEERLDRSATLKRPTFQALLYWDVFRGLYDARRPPALATFFTNHVASAMHRHWAEAFPEDFGGHPRAGFGAPLEFALEVLDRMIGEALALRADCPELVLAFASSMGQGAVHRMGHEGFAAAVRDVEKLLACAGIPAHSYSPLLAMVPQVAVEVRDAALREQTRARLAAARTRSGAPLFSVDGRGDTLSITIATPRRPDVEAGGFRLEGRDVGWDEGGITIHEVDAGTGYHVPEGILALVGREIGARNARTEVRATHVKAKLLAAAELA